MTLMLFESAHHVDSCWHLLTGCCNLQVTLPLRFLTTTAHFIAILTILFDVVGPVNPVLAASAFVGMQQQWASQHPCCRHAATQQQYWVIMELPNTLQTKLRACAAAASCMHAEDLGWLDTVVAQHGCSSLLSSRAGCSSAAVSGL